MAEDDFFDAGGDSLSAVAFLSEVEKALGRPVSPTVLFQAPRFADLVKALETAAPAAPTRPKILDHLLAHVPGWQGDRTGRDGLIFGIGTLSDKPPIFFTAQGQIGEIRALLDPDRPLYAMPSIRDKSIRTDAACTWLGDYYAAEIDALQPDGPLVLAGFCAGAHQMRFTADALHRRGRTVQLLVSIDRWFDRPTAYPVLHVLTETSQYSAAVLHHDPKRALGHLHPAGARILRVPGHHQEAINSGLMAPLRPAFAAALRDGLPQHPAHWLDFETRQNAYQAKIRLLAPALLSRHAPRAGRAVVTNISAITWPAYAQSGLALVVHGRNLDGFVRQRRLARVPLMQVLEPGQSAVFDLTLRYPDTGMPIWLETAMSDDGLAEFGQTKRLTWTSPLRAAG